jgi:chemotaxis protein histidine kinase CheA
VARTPSLTLQHARSVLTSIPRQNRTDVVEIDLSNREQLARLLESTPSATGSDQATGAAEPVQVRPGDVQSAFACFADFVERLLEDFEDNTTLEGLIASLEALRARSVAAGFGQIDRIVPCALRVIESHHSAGQALPLDAVEFIVACRRLIPMILESLDEPDRFSHAVDALVDQSSFVLLELRRGTRPLANLWPEPDETEYAEINAMTPAPDAPKPEIATGGATHEDPVRPSDSVAPDATIVPVSAGLSSSAKQTGYFDHRLPSCPVEHDDTPTLRIGASDLDEVMYLMTQLMVQSGGQHQRSRRLGVAIQDIAGTGDRMRYLLRAWSEGSLDAGDVTRQLEEITADLGLAAKEMDQLRGEFDAVADQQERIQAELNGSIARLRTVPLAVFLPDLERAVAEYAARFEKRARFQVQGDQVELDLLHAD